MSVLPYTSFVRWARATHYRGTWDDPDLSAEARAWTHLYGVTAYRMDRFLRLAHQNSATLPNLLVMDIMELNSSPLSRIHKDGVLRRLLQTWTGLVEVYGRISDPSDREMARLDLLADWGKTLLALPGSDFPGGITLVVWYSRERARLTLGRLERGRHDFKYVGIVLELIKVQEGIVWPRRTTRYQTTPILQRARKAPGCAKPKQRISNCADDDDQLPCLPTSRGPFVDPSKNPAFWLYGNWRDDWRNTLP